MEGGLNNFYKTEQEKKIKKRENNIMFTED
jgi:hypothetical protein